MKTIVIAGRLGKDGRIAHTQNGDAILSFPVAVDDGYGENKATMWFDCSLFGKRATALEPHLKKGTAVTVSGELGTREHEGKTYLKVRVSDVTMQGGGERRDNSTSYDDRGDYREQSGASALGFDDDDPDSIPF